MSSTHQDKSTGKPGKPGRKVEPRRQKSASPQGPKPEQRKSPEPSLQPKTKEQIGAVVASSDPSPIPAVAPPDASPISAATPAAAAPVSIQTIANAYRDYTRKSFEETTSFVGRLTGVRSLDKAIEIQTEFASRAYATFVAQSQKICELHNELARQTLKPLERLVTGTSRDARS